MSSRSPNRNVSTLYHRTVNSTLYWNYEIMQMQIMIIDRPTTKGVDRS